MLQIDRSLLTEIILSIILASSVPESLNILIGLEGDFLWPVACFIYIITVMAFIYKIIERKSKGWELILKLSNIILLSLLPFFISTYIKFPHKLHK